MSETREHIYAVRLTTTELAELRALADEKGVNLADAMRKGARQYLEHGSPQEAAGELRQAVDNAKRLLRNL